MHAIPRLIFASLARHATRDGVLAERLKRAASAAPRRGETSADIEAVGKIEEASIQQASAESGRATKATPTDVVTALKAVKKCGSVHP